MSFTTGVLFIAAMVTLGFADFATKQTSGRISPALGTLLYAVAATLPAMIWTIWTRIHAPLLVTKQGIVWALVTGLAFGVFAGILFFLFSHGVNLSVGTPIIRLGGIAFAAMLGIVVLREPFSLQSVAGFALAALGILLMALK